VERAQWGKVWDGPTALLSASYVDAVVRAGGIPVLLPPVDLPGAATSVVDSLDALLLTGGADVDPARYDAEPDPETRGLRPDRDRWEHDLLAAALERDLPVLAICRGVQVLDVALGGTLHQHVPDVVGHEGHRPVPGTFGRTQVKVEPGSRLAGIIGDTAAVPCHHHQCLDRVAEGLVVAARAEDGIVEAVEMPGRRFVVGVQWHPEEGDDPRLFDALVEATRG
jgi:gamma-glutamyl-gamma-aminobutyrate hydrolase PuuD